MSLYDIRKCHSDIKKVSLYDKKKVSLTDVKKMSLNDKKRCHSMT